MKTLLKLPFVVGLLIIIGMTSCKKDRVCTCTDGAEFGIINATPSQAKKECKDNESYEQSINGSDVSCKIQ